LFFILKSSETFVQRPSVYAFDNCKSVKSLADNDMNNQNLMMLQTKSEEIKNKEINRIINSYKEKFPDDTQGLKEKILSIFGKNEAKFILQNNLKVF